MEFSRKERNAMFNDFISVAGPWLGTYQPFDFLAGGMIMEGFDKKL